MRCRYISRFYSRNKSSIAPDSSFLNQYYSLGISFILLFATTACSSLQRSYSSGYGSTASTYDVQRDRRYSEYEEAVAELGLTRVEELNEYQERAIQLRMALKRAERNLTQKSEREQYFINKPSLKNDYERLEFLKLPSLETRERWLAAKGLSNKQTQYSPAIQSLVDANDITLGMTKQAVRDAWGEPDIVEVAGNPIYGNERWQYSEQVSSTEGYQTEHREIYFESGRVVGWKTF